MYIQHGRTYMTMRYNYSYSPWSKHGLLFFHKGPLEPWMILITEMSGKQKYVILEGSIQMDRLKHVEPMKPGIYELDLRCKGEALSLL